MRRQTLVSLTLLFWPTVVPAQAQNRQALARQVFEAESAFAQTLAARDSQAFAMYVAVDAVFLGRQGTLQGRAAVVAGWRPLFEGRAAPLSLDPQIRESLRARSPRLRTRAVPGP